jgi:hypothetical protein
MNSISMSTVIPIVISAMMTYALGSYVLMGKRFSKQDPRISSANYRFTKQFLPFIGLILLFSVLFFVASALGLVQLYRYVSYALVGFWLLSNYLLNKRYGHPSVKNEMPKIGVLNLNRILVGLLIPLIAFTLLDELLNLPKIYLQVSWIVFIAVFIASLFWAEKSRNNK